MKRVLAGQIRKHLWFLKPAELQKMQGFFDAVLEMYESFEQDRKLMERSIELSSEEMMQNNEKLFEQSEELQKVFSDIESLVQELEKGSENHNANMTLSDLSSYLWERIRESQKNRLEIIRQKNYLLTIVDSIGEGLIVLNAEGRIVMSNKIADNLIWLQRSELSNLLYYEWALFLPENPNDIIEDIVLRCLQKHTMEFLFNGVILRNVRGEKIPVSLIASPIGQHRDKTMGCVVVFRDITQERQLDKMKDEFVSIASHELRTPMTIISGYASLLLEKNMWELNADQEKYLGRIKGNIQHLIDLVNYMLNVSRLEAKKLEVEKQKISLQKFCEEMVDGFKNLYREKNISLTFSAQDIICNTDPDKLQQILINLLWNAYKFTPKDGSVKLVCEKYGDSVKFSVEDTGVWIQEKDLKALFRKFSQVNSYLHNKAEGTGLGLSICKMLVELLGGKIGVESQIGKGSVFFFTLPV